MKPISKTRSFGRSSRKREAGRTAPEKAIVLLVKTISLTAMFVILSGDVPRAIEKAARPLTA
jgi:hypothetical protein